MDRALVLLVAPVFAAQLFLAKTPRDWLALAAVTALAFAGYVLLREAQNLRELRRLFRRAQSLPWDRAAAFAKEHKKGALVEASGRVAVRTPVIGPISGERAAFWHCRVEERTPQGWRLLDESHSEDELELQEAGVRLAVLPARAEVRLDGDPYVWAQKEGEVALPPHLSLFLRRRRLPMPDGAAPLRFVEWRVFDGEPLSALGRFEPVSRTRGLIGGLYALDGSIWISHRSPRQVFQPKGRDLFWLGAALMVSAAALGGVSALRLWGK